MPSSSASAPTTVPGADEPVAAHRPQSVEALQALVREHDGTTLVPVSGGTRLALGNVPRGPYALVYLDGALGGDVDHEEADLTAIVPAGVTIDALNAILAERGQRLPLDPPHPDRATIGGSLATGEGGPLAGRFGRPRDFVLGMTVLRADGELVKAGGRVTKNVTGYDLMRLWCGSLGTLGLTVSVALRVYPARETVDIVAPAASYADAAALIDRVYIADVRPEIADALFVDGVWQVLLRADPAALPALETAAGASIEVAPAGLYALARDLRGPSPPAPLPSALASARFRERGDERFASDAPNEAGQSGYGGPGQSVASETTPGAGDTSNGVSQAPSSPASEARSATSASGEEGRGGEGSSLVLRVAATPRLLGDAVAQLARLSPAAAVARPLASGGRWSWDTDSALDPAQAAASITALRAALAPVGGSVVVEQQPDGWGLDAWGEPPPSFAIMQAAKQAWDPDGRLNRGRFIGGV